MPSRTASVLRSCLVVAAMTGMLGLTACAPEPAPTAASGSPAASSSAAASATPDTTPGATPTASPAAVALPTDCRAILSATVLSQLGETPLNPENFGPVGVQPDGSLICLWRDPRADVSHLITTISRMSRGPALELLNGLAAEGFGCYTPSGGTRCEKTWPNTEYPVTDGRTLFWRDDVLIDTRFSNLAPTGYTDSIVAHLFPA